MRQALQVVQTYASAVVCSFLVAVAASSGSLVLATPVGPTDLKHSDTLWPGQAPSPAVQPRTQQDHLGEEQGQRQQEDKGRGET
jgi:hypothetical protein